MPKKWYAVTAGREIGVFSDWLEAGAAVKGLDDAIYKGYPTEEEAKRAFITQKMKGNTQVIQDGQRFQPGSDLVHFPGTRQRTGNSQVSHTPQRLAASLSMPAQLPSTPPATPRKEHHDTQTPYTPSLYSGGHSHRSSPVMRQRLSSSDSKGVSTLSSGRLLSPLKAPEEREAARVRRLEAIEQCYKVDALQKSESLASSPISGRSGTHSYYTADSTVSSPCSGTPFNKSRAPRVIVKTPNWIHSYPEATGEGTFAQASSLLSPLNLAGVSDLPDVLGAPVEMKCKLPLVKYATEPNILHITSAGCISPYTSDSYDSSKSSTAGVPVDPRSPKVNKKAVVVHDLQFASPIPIAGTLANLQLGVRTEAKGEDLCTSPWD